MTAARLRLILILAAVAAAFTAPRAFADASGCSRDFARGTPSQASDSTPVCAPGGDGCYECAYDHRNLGGYDLCAEPVDSSTEGGAIAPTGGNAARPRPRLPPSRPAHPYFTSPRRSSSTASRAFSPL